MKRSRTYPQWPKTKIGYVERCPSMKVWCDKHIAFERCNNDAKDKFGGYCYAHRKIEKEVANAQT